MTFPENPFCSTYSGNFDPKQARVTKERKERYWGWVFSFIILGLAGSLQAQTQDTLMLDSTAVRVEKVNAGDSIAGEIHSPRKASIYSAVLPGLGQVYNKKYWKVPIIYAGFGALGYFIGWNNKNFNMAKRAYSDLTDTIPETNSYMKLKQIIYYDLNKASDVASLKKGLTSSQDYFRRNRDLLIIVTAAFYGLNIIDASVDAHFFNFDISDDLTLRWEPVIRQTQNQNIFCVNCSIKF